MAFHLEEMSISLCSDNATPVMPPPPNHESDYIGGRVGGVSSSLVLRLVYFNIVSRKRYKQSDLTVGIRFLEVEDGNGNIMMYDIKDGGIGSSRTIQNNHCVLHFVKVRNVAGTVHSCIVMLYSCHRVVLTLF